MKSATAPYVIALTTALGTGGIAHAGENPFALSSLAQGYQLAATDKTANGKCGEGKCGDKKQTNAANEKGTVVKDAKAKDGKRGAKK